MLHGVNVSKNIKGRLQVDSLHYSLDLIVVTILWPREQRQLQGGRCTTWKSLTDNCEPFRAWQSIACLGGLLHFVRNDRLCDYWLAVIARKPQVFVAIHCKRNVILRSKTEVSPYLAILRFAQYDKRLVVSHRAEYISPTPSERFFTGFLVTARTCKGGVLCNNFLILLKFLRKKPLIITCNIIAIMLYE